MAGDGIKLSKAQQGPILSLHALTMIATMPWCRSIHKRLWSPSFDHDAPRRLSLLTLLRAFLLDRSRGVKRSRSGMLRQSQLPIFGPMVDAEQLRKDTQ